MDKTKGQKNIMTSIASKLVLLLVALYVRRLLIYHIGNEANGLNSLYTTIIGMLSVAELGIGGGIVYSMYKPIVDGNTKKITALYCLYKKLYRIVGAVIFVAGCMVMPFLPRFIEDYDRININVYITFFLTLVSVVLTYLYSAKTSLIEAYKNNYITTAINTVARLIKSVLQIAVIIIWKSYTLYVASLIIETLLLWVMTEYTARKMHGDILCQQEELDGETKEEVSHNVKALFMHKIGSILANAVDSLVISSFIGVIILGKYANYTVILGAMTGLITLFFTPLTSVIGHLCATGDKEAIKKQFDHFYALNYVLGVVFFLGYFAVIDNLVVFFFGEEQKLITAIPFIITINGFVHYMRNAVLLFRDASGTFYQDRWKAVIEGFINLALSVLLVCTLPDRYSVVGVVLATAIVNLLLCDTVEPFVFYKHVLKESVKGFYIKNYLYIAYFTGLMLLIWFLRRQMGNSLYGAVINGIISLIISVLALLVLSLADKAFRREAEVLLRQGLSILKKKSS